MMENAERKLGNHIPVGKSPIIELLEQIIRRNQVNKKFKKYESINQKIRGWKTSQ